MRSLADDKKIVIKKADKGLRVVVWDRDYYLLQAERQLRMRRFTEMLPLTKN